MFPYIYTTIVTLPLGYNTKVIIPVKALKERISKDYHDFEVEVKFTGFREGKIFHDELKIINKASQGFLEFEIEDQDKFSQFPGYAELSFIEKNKKSIFTDRQAMSFYTTYYHKNKKSFLSDNAYKFGSPATINQMASIKKYIDAYPTVTIDKRKDLDESLVFINPYKRKIKSYIISSDGRKIENIIISPFSAKEILLSKLLKENESCWQGHVQLTASNRLITFNFKHSYSNKKIISDYEHLDPFRGDPTYIPLTKFLRQKIGSLFSL